MKMTSVSDKISAAVARNPVAWFLFALLAISIYGNYQRGKELDAVCDVFPMPVATHTPPANDFERAANICIERREN